MNFHKIIFLIAVFLILIPYVGDNDFWLHLRMGELIVEEGHFPRTDVLSFTGEGKEWINHEWFPQTAFYQLFKYGGFVAVSLFSSLMGTVLFALLIRGRKFSWPLAIFLFLIAYNLKPFIVPRPQIFAYALLLGLVLAIGWYYRTGSRKIIFVLPTILFLWGNVHASVILVLPIFAAVLAFEFGPLAKFNRYRLGYQEKIRLLWVMGISLGFSLLNPFGYKIYWQALQPIRFREAFNFLIETRPIYDLSFPILLLTHLAIIFVVFGHTLKRRWEVLKTYEFVIFVLFVAMPFFAVKYTPFAWVAILPIFLKILPDLNGKKLFANIAIASIALASVWLFFNERNLFKDPDSEWPREMAGFIKDNELRGNAYNPYSWSGYFVWKNKKSVFINPALADLGGEAFWDAMDFDKGEKTDEIIKKHDLSFVIAQPWAVLPYSLSLKNDWSLIYWDNYGVIFAKKGRGNDGIIEKYELTIKYFNDSIGGVLKKYPAGEIPDLIENYKEAIKRQPDLLLARYRLGLIYQRSGDCKEAIVQYKALLNIDQKLGSARFRLAECYQETGNLRLAKSEKKLAEKFEGKERWWKGRR